MGVKLQCLTGEGKSVLVRIIGSFEKLGIREIGILLYNNCTCRRGVAFLCGSKHNFFLAVSFKGMLSLIQHSCPFFVYQKKVFFVVANLPYCI